MGQTKPILLLSDSQLLFMKDDKENYFLRYFVGDESDKSLKCAYIGASNGDEEVFFDLFKEAMGLIGQRDCKMISSDFKEDEQEYLDKADLILLAGGDAEQGLHVFRKTGMEKVLQRKFQEGTFIIGVSAGAVQLGWQTYSFTGSNEQQEVEGLKFIPFIVLVHTDKKNNEEVETLLKRADTIKRAYEIPAGAGVIYHADDTMEALRKPVNEFILKEEVFVNTIILPKKE